MKRLISVAIFFMVFLLSISIVNAKANEWKSKTYDFPKIKSVLFIGPFIEKEVEDQFAYQKTNDVLTAELAKRKIPIIFENQLAEAVGKDVGVDMKVLYKTDNAKYLSLLREHGPKYVDAVLVADVQRLGYTQQYEEGYEIPFQTSNTSSFFGTTSSGGSYSGTVTSPSTNYIHVRGGYRDCTTAAYSMVMYDTNLNVIWGFSDIRSHRLTRLSRSGPEDVLKRIIKVAFDKVPIQPKEN